MKSKRGRPKTLKAKEVKKPFPMRFSDKELKVFKLTAGEQPLRDWMRQVLINAAVDKAYIDKDKKLTEEIIDLLGEPPEETLSSALPLP